MEKYEDIIQIISKPSKITENKVYYDFTDENTTSTSDRVIVSPDYDISPAIDPSDLDETNIEEIAQNIYLNNKLGDSTSKTESSSYSTKSSSKSNLSSKNSSSGNTTSVSDMTNYSTGVEGFFESADKLVDSGVNSIIKVLKKFVKNDNGISTVLTNITNILNDNLTNYKDGISETSFGSLMENSWQGNTTKSFLNYFNNKYKNVSAEMRKINIMKSTPLDSGSVRESLYGNMILGVPYCFTSLADPHNRTLINSFIKDGKILSLTPGMPKYNGLTSYSNISNSILNQTENPEEMLNYLLRNGLDKGFSEKDKRYYTFETKYEDYFAYLETMLNTVWIKLGLAKSTDEQFNLFSFFNIKSDSEGGISYSNYNQLLSQYNSSIGFYTNITSAVSESIDSQTTGFGADLASQANANSQDYQRLNYITGMGTGPGTKNLSRKVGVSGMLLKHLKTMASDTFTSTGNALSSFDATKLSSAVASIAKVGIGLGTDIINFNNTQDIGAVMQSFATSNGMRVTYPELWEDSSYSKNINFNFTFTSPYGDPLSIFKYVYVPFLSLACFALPRQAAENGYVSPFFVRADVPGLITSDLAMITSLTWTKGGSSGLWTKDGLPRSIECSITLTDLYPYLSMTKRISFLSANPSYTVFLDNMTGMCALNDNSVDDGLNEYFKQMIDRVNGVSQNSSLWNRFNSAKSTETLNVMNSKRGSVSGKIGKHSVPWLHNSSL